VRQSISEIDSSPLRDFQYEDNSVFRLELDTQLVHWLNKRPDDWVLAWGGERGYLCKYCMRLHIRSSYYKLQL